jgi:hypothetical protein
VIPDYRGPLTWEIFHPLPLATTKRQIKARIRRTNFDLRMIRTAVPDFDIMHPLHAELPEECQLITTFDLRSINYAYMARVPNYENYIKTCNFSSAMLWHSRFLRALEKNNKPDTWLLKDPWHIQHIPEFLSTYPKACFVFTIEIQLRSSLRLAVYLPISVSVFQNMWTKMKLVSIQFLFGVMQWKNV